MSTPRSGRPVRVFVSVRTHSRTNSSAAPRCRALSQFSESSARSPKTVGADLGAGHLEGALKLLTLAARVAIAWTLLSLLLTALWWLLLQFGRRFGTRPASKPSAPGERRLSAEVRAIYADFADVQGASSDGLAHGDPDEAGERDAIVFVGWSTVQER